MKIDPNRPRIGSHLLASICEALLAFLLFYLSPLAGGLIWWAVRLFGHVRNGQSPAKMLFGIRLVDLKTYSHPTLVQALLHDVLFLALYAFFFLHYLNMDYPRIGGFLMILSIAWIPLSLFSMAYKRAEGRTLSDLWSHTIVVSARHSSFLEHEPANSRSA